MVMQEVEKPLALEVIEVYAHHKYAVVAKLVKRIEALKPEAQQCLAEDLLTALKNRLVVFERCPW